jgi:hypothetical protein
MLPEEWPIAAPAADQTAPARLAGGDRLATVRADFFLDSATRLTEQERALMTAMLHCLVADLADEIRAALPKGAAAANDDSNIGLVDTLSASRLLDRAPLVRLLLRRADEERIAAAATARSGRREARALQGLVSHADGAVAAAAMSLILARGRRRDRFGQCRLQFDDLSPDDSKALVQMVSAALRGDMVAALGSAETDRRLAAAAARVLSSHDFGNGIEALTANLVRLLDEEQGLTDDLIVAAALEGEMTFIAQALARRSGVRAGIALDELLSGHERRAMAVLRAASLQRPGVARLLAGVGDLLGIADPGKAIDAFDGLSDAEVEDARTWLTTDPDYRNAVSALGKSNG